MASFPFQADGCIFGGLPGQTSATSTWQIDGSMANLGEAGLSNEYEGVRIPNANMRINTIRAIVVTTVSDAYLEVTPLGFNIVLVPIDAES
jgi:hypothetical protein